MGKDLRVALIGAGRAGLVHGRNLAAGVRGARLAGVCEPDPAARAAALAELECDSGYADPAEVLADDTVDAVVIAAPTFTHAGIAGAALAAGKHVLCEKPLASTLEEAVAVRTAARRSPAVFLMGFMRRFDAGFARAAQRLAAGEIGEPLLVRSTGRGPGLPPPWSWRTEHSGGLVAEVNSHDLDTLRWFSGQELTRVYAVGRAAKRPELAAEHPGFIDLVTATYELSGGAVGQLDGACPADYGYDARVEIYGSEGALLIGDVRANHTLRVRADGVAADPVTSWRTLFAEAYRAELAHLVAVARGAEPARTSVDDGVAALAGAIATNRAVAARTPVEVESPAVDPGGA